MAVKPGYKQTEVGVIPEDWELKALQDVFTLKSGFAFSSEHFSKVGPIVLTPGNFLLEGGLYFEDRNTKRYSGDYSAKMTFSRGDLLIVMTDLTPDCNLLGKPAVVQSNEVILHNQRIGKVVLRDNSLELPLLFFMLLSRPYLRRIREQAVGSTVRHTSNKSIYSVQLPWPPLPEQRAIATALSDVDALLDALEQLIVKKRDLKQAATQQLLTGQARLPGFHGEWEVKRLGEICEIAMGRTPPRLNKSLWGRGYKWLSIADLQTKVVSESKEEITELAASTMDIIPKGTLLMSFKLSIGRLCFAGCDLFTNEAICSFKKLQASGDFLYYALGRTDFSLYGKQAVKGYTLNKESLKIVEVHLPSLPEQNAIAAVLTDMDAELAALEQRFAKTRALKQGMMQELLTGRTRLI